MNPLTNPSSRRHGESRRSLRRASAPVVLVVFAGTTWSCSDTAPEADGSTNTTALTVTGSATTSSTSSAGPTSMTSASATSGATTVTSGTGQATTATSGMGSSAAATSGTGGGSTTASSSAGDTTATSAVTTGSGGADTTGTTTGTGGTTGGTSPDDVCPFTPTATPAGSNWVNGELVEFNDNGGWCWYQDERVIVDQEAGKIILSSVASGGSRDTDVEVVHWDIATRQGERHFLGSMGYADDHDVAALAKRPDGGYVAMWAGHNDDCKSYYSTYDGDAWSQARSFDWPSSGCPTSSGKRITYANAWYLEDTLYSYVRSLDTSPHYLFSQDDGESWELGGRLTSTPQVGYVAGYYKYWGNNTDRLDFFGTEAHPRDNDNSLYHGYIQDEKIHDSFGTVIDDDFTDREAENVPAYTKVFATGTTINGARLEHLWNADLVRYDDGTIAAIGSGRVSGTGSDDPDKRLLYFRFDGTEWKTTYLVRAGSKLYSSEQDYTGLGALHPDNPHIIYISTPYDPRTDEGDFSGTKEIWKGVTCDDGATFTWEPVTANSTEDQLRPVVPKWDVNHTALLWLSGTYSSAQTYSQKVVGLVTSDE